MRGTPSRRTTSASFPIERRIWQQPKAEPMASPSGRACEVNKNRRRCSICLRTSFNILPTQPLGSKHIRLSFLLPRPTQQFNYSRAVLVGAVQVKIQFGGTTKAEVLRHLATDT